MNWLWRTLLWVAAQQAKAQILHEAKRRGVAAYLRTLGITRRLLLVVFLGFICLQLMVMCGVGALVTGFLIWDYEFAAKMEILFWIFLGLFAVPTVLLLILFSERLWFRVSGAKRMMEELNS